MRRRLEPGRSAFSSSLSSPETTAASSRRHWAWAAFSSWLLVAVLLALRWRLELGALDLTMIAGAVGLAGWFALSAVWSRSVPATLDESFRYFAYAGIVVAALVVVERATVPHVLGGVTAAVTLLSAYALGTRLLPDRLGEFASITNYRLSGTIGYWNGLGIFAVMGLFLAFGFAARGKQPATRAVAGAALPVLAATTYFTFSRGAWLALLAGLVAAFAVEPRRLQLAFVGAVLGVLPAASVVACSTADGLTQAGAPFASAVHDGHRLVPTLALLAGLSATAAVLLWLAERRVRVPSSLRRAWAAVLVVALLAGVAAVWVGEGSPWHVADRAWEKARGTPQATTNTGRLVDLSSNGRFELWRLGWDTFVEHPIAGDGGGSYWQAWAGSPRGSLTSTEAHSVYVETLAELGLVGLRVAVRTADPAVRRESNAGLAARAVRACRLFRLGRARERGLGLGVDGSEQRRADLRSRARCGGPQRATHDLPGGAWWCARHCVAARRGFDVGRVGAAAAGGGQGGTGPRRPERRSRGRSSCPTLRALVDPGARADGRRAARSAAARRGARDLSGDHTARPPELGRVGPPRRRCNRSRAAACDRGGRLSQPAVPRPVGVSGRGNRELVGVIIVAVALGALAALGGLGSGLSGLGNSAKAAGGSLEAVVQPPAGGAPPPLRRDWRLTPANAVIFYGGYFCARGGQGGRGGQTVRLILALRELDALTRGTTKLVGPFTTKPQARGAC